MSVDTSKAALDQIISDIEGEFACRCGPEYTDRRLHHPECRYYMREAIPTLRALLAERDAAYAAGQRDMQARAAEACKWHSDQLVEIIRALPIKDAPVGD